MAKKANHTNQADLFGPVSKPTGKTQDSKSKKIQDAKGDSAKEKISVDGWKTDWKSIPPPPKTTSPPPNSPPPPPPPIELPAFKPTNQFRNYIKFGRGNRIDYTPSDGEELINHEQAMVQSQQTQTTNNEQQTT